MRLRESTLKRIFVEQMDLSFSLGEAAGLIGKRREGLRKWIHKGLLEYGKDYWITPGGQYRIKASWIKRVTMQ